MRRSRLTDISVSKLKPVPGKQLEFHDSIVPRLYVRVNYGGSKAWYITYYVAGKPHTKKLGDFPKMGVKPARDAARKFEEDPAGSLAKAEVGTFAEIAEQFLERHVRKTGLRSASDVERHIEYANRYWRHREFLSIRRQDISCHAATTRPSE